MENEYLKIAIGSDHAGFELKRKIIHKLKDNFEIIDFGAQNGIDSVDYPSFGFKVANYVKSNMKTLGILVCGSGIGISIAANRIQGIRCALLYSDEVAELAKSHNNANIIAFGQKTMDHSSVLQRISIFLKASFLGDRHLIRITQLDK